MQTISNPTRRLTLSLFDRKAALHAMPTPAAILSSNELKKIVADMVG